MVRTPVRHDLLHFDPSAWPILLGGRPDLQALNGVRDWQTYRYPLMSRRRQPDDPAGGWPVGIALPPSQGKLRLALNIAPEHVVSVEHPPLLRDALDGRLSGRLPGAWTARSTQLDDACATVGLAPRLFGGAMWQCVTGVPYLTDNSDLDLIWPVPADAIDRVPDLLRALGLIDAMDGPRLDGEIVFGSAGAVQWRELAAAGPDDTILVKTETTVEIMTRAQLLASASGS